MSKNHEAAKLDDLIVTTIDSAKGYELAATEAEAGALGDFFARMAAERRAVVDDLQAGSRALGATPNEHGSVAAGIHRRVLDIRTAFGGGDEAVLSEIEHGEAYLDEEFGRVLKDDSLSPPVRALVERSYATVARGRDSAAALRDRMTADA